MGNQTEKWDKNKNENYSLNQNKPCLKQRTDKKHKWNQNSQSKTRKPLLHSFFHHKQTCITQVHSQLKKNPLYILKPKWSKLSLTNHLKVRLPPPLIRKQCCQHSRMLEKNANITQILTRFPFSAALSVSEFSVWRMPKIRVCQMSKFIPLARIHTHKHTANHPTRHHHQTSCVCPLRLCKQLRVCKLFHTHANFSNRLDSSKKLVHTEIDRFSV